MSIDKLFRQLRKYNGLDLQVRLDDVILDVTWVHAEQLGNATKSQLKATVLVHDFERDVYKKLQRLVGEQVAVRFGNSKGMLVLDSTSIVQMNEDWDEEREQPFDLVFSEAAQVTAMKLADQLRTAGWISIADELELIQARTSQTGHVKMVTAINMLRDMGKYGLSERLDEQRRLIWGEDEPSAARRKQLITQIDGLVRTYLGMGFPAMLPGEEYAEEPLPIVDELVALIKPILDEEGRRQFAPAPMDEDEVDAIGPGFETGKIRVQPTVSLRSTSPNPTRF